VERLHTEGDGNACFDDGPAQSECFSFARRAQCQINRVAGLIPVENETVLTTLHGFPLEAFRQMPKAVGYMQGSRLALQLTCELLP